MFVFFLIRGWSGWSWGRVLEIRKKHNEGKGEGEKKLLPKNSKIPSPNPTPRQQFRHAIGQATSMPNAPKQR